MTSALIIGILFFALAIFEIWRDGANRKELVELSKPKPIQQQLTPIKSNRILPEIYRGDILDELSRTSLHILFGVMSGGGKSTSMKVIIWKIHTYNPSARFFIVDPKATDWLGLQLYPDTVFYLSGEVLDKLIQLKSVTQQVFNLLDERIAQGQKSLKAGGSVDHEPEHDVYLIIDEWYVLLDALKKLPAKLKAEHKLNLIEFHVNAIIATGREHKVHGFLVGQTHLSGEIGLSTAMRRSVALVGQGRLTSTGEGGYASIEGIIKDANVFRHAGKREYLMQCLQLAIAEAGNSPIILTTMGNPRIGVLDDLSHIHSYKITDYLQSAALPRVSPHQHHP